MGSWDDLRVPLANTRINPALSSPSLTTFRGGLLAYAFTSTNLENESLHFAVQMPHSYSSTTTLRPHVHWCPADTSTGNVYWELEYAWAKVGEAFTGTPSKLTAYEPGNGTAYEHQITELGNLPRTDDAGLSSMLVCRLTRLSTNANDTYTADAYALEFDFHFERDAIGSRQELTK